jgi:hypothetical protein
MCGGHGRRGLHDRAFPHPARVGATGRGAHACARGLSRRFPPTIRCSGHGRRVAIYTGQLLAYGAQLVNADVWSVGLAAVIAAVGAFVPRVLSGPAERPALAAPTPPLPTSAAPPELRMGLQAALGGLVVHAAGQARPFQSLSSRLTVVLAFQA